MLCRSLHYRDSTRRKLPPLLHLSQNQGSRGFSTRWPTPAASNIWRTGRNRRMSLGETVHPVPQQAASQRDGSRRGSGVPDAPGCESASCRIDPEPGAQCEGSGRSPAAAVPASKTEPVTRPRWPGLSHRRRQSRLGTRSCPYARA